MSTTAVFDILDHNRTETQNQLLMLLALADGANDEGSTLFYDVDRLKGSLFLRIASYDKEPDLRMIFQRLIDTGQIVCHDWNDPVDTSLLLDLVYSDGSNWAFIEKHCEEYGTPFPPHPQG